MSKLPTVYRDEFPFGGSIDVIAEKVRKTKYKIKELTRDSIEIARTLENRPNRRFHLKINKSARRCYLNAHYEKRNIFGPNTTLYPHWIPLEGKEIKQELEKEIKSFLREIGIICY